MGWMSTKYLEIVTKTIRQTGFRTNCELVDVNKFTKDNKKILLRTAQPESGIYGYLRYFSK